MSISIYQKSGLVFALILYAVFASVLFYFYQYKLFPDTISYIAITQKYLNGDFYDAINGFWAPLLSWFLIPFLWVGISPLIAAKVSCIISGAGVIISTDLLSRRFEISRDIRNIVILTTVPLTLYFAFHITTPDLLMLCLLLFYLNIVFDPNYGIDRPGGVSAGVLGGLAYLSKHYAFPFFLSHFILMNGLHYLRRNSKEERKRVLYNLTLGLLTFSTISGIWIGVMSFKYNQFTISNAAKYNYALVGPNSRGFSVGYQGFLAPSNETAISAWEDPSTHQMKSWHPFKSMDTVKHLLKLILKSIITIVDIFRRFSIFSFTIVLVYLFYLFPFNLKTLHNKKLDPLITICLYNSGYVFLIQDERYFWINAVLLLLMGGFVLSELCQYSFFNAVRKKILLCFFVASFAAHPLLSLAMDINKDKDIFMLSKILNNKYHIRGNTASHNSYKIPLYLSFYLNCRYFGAAEDNINCQQLADELKRYDIDYYFVREARNIEDVESLVQDCPELNFTEITNGKIPDFRIFKVNKH